MISRTSWPRASSASAWSSACSTTAPQNDHENGTTMPIFTAGGYALDGGADISRRSSSAARPGRGVLPGARERLELVGAEPIEEQSAHAVEVRRARFGEAPAAVLGQRREEPTPVCRAADALDEPCTLEAVDETGQAALAEQRSVARARSSAAARRGRREEQQHLELVQRQPVRLDELTVELVDEGRVEPDEAAPRLPDRVSVVCAVPCIRKYLTYNVSDRPEFRPGPPRKERQHALRGSPPRHVHHGRCTGKRRLLRPRARAEAREEVREPGRPDRLPPLLRRRGGQRRGRHHLLRVPGCPPRPRRATG